MSKPPEPEVGQLGGNKEVDRRTSTLEETSNDRASALKQISPKAYKDLSVGSDQDADQAPGSAAIQLNTSTWAIKVEDTVNVTRGSTSRYSNEELVGATVSKSSTVSGPQSKHTLPDQPLPLSAEVLSSYQNLQKGADSQELHLSTSCLSEGKSQFEILAEGNASSSSSTGSSTSQESGEGTSQFEILAEGRVSSSSTTGPGSSSDSYLSHHNDQDGVGGPSSSKHPLQVVDSEGRSLHLSDLLKGELQFSQPSSRGREVKGMAKVAAGKFPSYEELNKDTGRIIFSTEGNLPAGEVSMRLTPGHFDYLGHGGYGRVFRFPIRGKEYAAKRTHYRMGELNVWSQLHHPNVIPLLGVIMGRCAPDCYQLMPLMTGSLRSMMSGHGDVYSHLVNNKKQWCVVVHNTLFIFEELLKGLAYFDKLNIQHSDLKADNILVKKSCKCKNLLYCYCSLANKYIVQIADFDSVKQTNTPRLSSEFPVCRQGLVNKKSVKGTLEYRAPEQFMLCPKLKEFKKQLCDGREYHDMEGPWCDLWSLGVILLNLILGPHNKNKRTFINEVNILSRQDVSSVIPDTESFIADRRFQYLMKLQLIHPELKPFACLACQLLEVDCSKRSPASQVLATVTVKESPVCEVTLKSN